MRPGERSRAQNASCGGFHDPKFKNMQNESVVMGSQAVVGFGGVVTTGKRQEGAFRGDGMFHTVAWVVFTQMETCSQNTSNCPLKARALCCMSLPFD